MRVQSIERAAKILKAFSVEEPELGVTELGRRMGLHKSTVHGLVTSLEQVGLVARNPRTRRYRLGLGLVELGYTVCNSHALLRIAHPYLRYLSDTIGELAYLGVRAGDDRLNVLQVESPHLMESVGWVPRAPLHCTSTGKVFLAHMPEDELEAYLDKGLISTSPQSITDPSELRRQLQTVREEGFATSLGEFKVGTNAIAVPVRKDAEIIATLAMVGHSYRFTHEKAIDSLEMLTGTATQVTEKLRAVPAGELELFG